MKNFFILILIFLIISAMVLGILHVTGIFEVKDFLIEKAKENPKLAEWMKTHEEVVTMSTKITELDSTITDKDQNITELQVEIEKLKSQLEQRDQQIAALNNQINGLETKLADHSIRVKEMADIYNEMERNKAAEILQGLDNELIVQIFKTLKKDAAAEILSFFSTERAASITKEYTLWEKK